jgi:hypothetical protein
VDKVEAARRDKVLRQFIMERFWDKSPEFLLIQELVREGHELLEGYPFLVEYEWEVEQGSSQYGRGDLLFTDGEGSFAVVEAKWIDLDSTGPTASNRRTKKRKQVRDQAWRYARGVERLYRSDKVVGYAHTNELPMQCEYSSSEKPANEGQSV